MLGIRRMMLGNTIPNRTEEISGGAGKVFDA